MQPSAEAGGATQRRGSVTASQAWQARTVTDALWDTGALEKMAVILVTVPETATPTLETVSMGKQGPFYGEIILWLTFGPLI